MLLQVGPSDILISSLVDDNVQAVLKDYGVCQCYQLLQCFIESHMHAYCSHQWRQTQLLFPQPLQNRDPAKL